MRRLLAGARTSSLAVVVALAACVSGSNGGRSPITAAAAPVPFASDGAGALYVGRTETADAGLETLHDVVLRFRPEWLRSNPTSRGAGDPMARASVYADGVYSGEIDVLQAIPTRAVIDLRYLPPTEARNRFGSACHCAGGVILVRTRSDGD